MNDAVHVKIKIVEFLAIWIRPRSVDGNSRAVFHCDGLILNHWRDDLGVFVGKPSECRWDTHFDEVVGVTRLSAYWGACANKGVSAEGD